MKNNLPSLICCYTQQQKNKGHIYPSIFPNWLSESQLSLGEKRGTLWTDGRSIAGLTETDCHSRHSWMLTDRVKISIPQSQAMMEKGRVLLQEVVELKYLVVLFTSWRKAEQSVAVKTDLRVLIYWSICVSTLAYVYKW